MPGLPASDKREFNAVFARDYKDVLVENTILRRGQGDCGDGLGLRHDQGSG
jgi:hypothetical protein